jgi:hypothetical protein
MHNAEDGRRLGGCGRLPWIAATQLRLFCGGLCGGNRSFRQCQAMKAGDSRSKRWARKAPTVEFLSSAFFNADDEGVIE